MLISALQDIQETTLAAVRGLLRKLEYLAYLQDRRGSYSHWGISRVHGDAAAQQALAEAHRQVLSHVLQTPISRLLEDVEKSSSSAGLPAEVYAQSLVHRTPSMLPPEPGAGSEPHLKSVFHALLSLLRAQSRDASVPTSWRYPPLGQSLLPPGDSAGCEAPPGTADEELGRSPRP